MRSSNKLSSAWAKITTADLTSGAKDLPLPPPRTRDATGATGGSPDLCADFLFAGKFLAATVAKVTGFTDAAHSIPILEIASLADVTAWTTAITVTDAQAPCHEVDGVRYAGYPAGIPDRAYAISHGISYENVCAQWGPEPTDPDFPGKIDAAGDRKRMADWQYLYQTDLSKIPELRGHTPSSGDGLVAGDFILFGTYRAGTGQVMSGGTGSVTQYNRPYVVSIYDTAGVRKVADFWRQNILDAEMIGLLRENAARNPSDAVFEDSLKYEVFATGPLWALGLLEAITSATGYAAAKYAPVFATPPAFARSSGVAFDDTATANRLLEDRTTAMARKYENEHIVGIEKWAATFGFKFKAQAEAMAGTNLVSNESLSFVATDYATPWLPLAVALNSYWGAGANRVVYHGSPFPKTFNDYHDAWPGWEFPFASSGLGAFDARQIYWADMNQLSGYVARTQAVLQSGRTDVDLAVLEGADARYALPSGNTLQGLLNAGYSYHILDEAMLNLPAATMTSGILAASGPSYRALIVSQVTVLSVATVDKLIGYAQADLPVILCNSPITRVYGTQTPQNNDALLANRVQALTSLGNVSVACTEDQVSAILARAGVTPAASYSVPGLVSSHRSAQGSDYYLLWNEGTSLASPAAKGDTGIRVVTAQGLRPGDQILIDTGTAAETACVASITSIVPGLEPEPNVLLAAPLTKEHTRPTSLGTTLASTLGAGVSAAVGKKITLTGSGIPYALDSWTGQVTPLAEYTADHGTVTFDLTMPPQAVTLVALDSSNSQVPIHAISSTGGQVLYADGQLIHRADTAGSYTIAFSDGRKPRELTVAPKPAPVLTSGWDLLLESWGPDAAADAVNPTISAKTTVPFGNVALGPWSALPASPSQLAALAVTSMSQVAGIGTYTRQFTLPAGWAGADGAYLQLTHGDDMVVAVTINGHRLGTVDPFTDKLGLGPFLRPGSNTLTVRIDTTLNNRVPGKSGQPYGLTGVQLIPYVQTAL